MKRRQLLIAAGAVAIARLAHAQKERVRRIGVLVATSVEEIRPSIDGFRARLASLGWTEGRNIEIEIWAAGGRNDQFAALAREAVARKVELIVAASTPGAQAAHEVAPTIPLVFAHIGDPVGSGFVASYARPGGHATGTAIRMLDIVGKQIELLKALVPAARQVTELRDAALRKTAGPISVALERAATSAGITITPLNVGKAEEIEPAFAAAVRARAQAVMVMPTVISFKEIDLFVKAARQHRMPAIYSSRAQVAAGGLASYGPDFIDAFIRTAAYVDRILRGAKPADLPVEQVDRFELVINRKTAAELGLTIPQSLLIQATEVIE